MNITQAIVRVRDILDDSNANALKYTDAEIARHFDGQLLSLFRMKLRTDKEWSNFTLALQKEDARQLFANTFEWRLPTWVEAVIRVFQRGDTSGTGETTLSPYKWTTTPPTSLGGQVKKTDPQRRDGWTWEGHHTLRLWNWGSAPELTIEVAVSPPPIFRATIAQIPAAPVATSLFFPAVPVATDLGDMAFTEEGRFINADVHVSATTGATDLKLGEIRRVIYSKAATLDAGVRRHQLDFDAAFASNFAVGDVVQTILPIEPVHHRVLFLLVANACFEKKFNIDAQKSISGELGQELTGYIECASRPRDSSGPFYKTSYRSDRPRRYDPNLLYGAYP